MSLTELVLMPGGDYQQICDNLRQALGTEDAITSHEAAEKIGALKGEIDHAKEAYGREQQFTDSLISGVASDGTIDYYNDRINSVRDYVFYGEKHIARCAFPEATSCGGYAFTRSTMSEIHLPKLKQTSTDMVYACRKLTLVDLGYTDVVAGSFFGYCELLTTIIFRNTSQPVLMIAGATNTFRNTPFAAGGTGGKIYVPQAFIKRYQNDTNWSVLYQQGTCEFVALEGSEYE